MKPQVVSTRWTFFFKLVLPTLWICFFGGMAIITLFADIQVSEPFTPLSAKLLIVSFAISTIGMIYLLFMRIKWVAMDKTHLYVSNFFKLYKYTYTSIAQIEETKVLFWKRVTIHFHEAGTFGKTIFFISSYYWTHFMDKNPEIIEQIFQATTTSNE